MIDVKHHFDRYVASKGSPAVGMILDGEPIEEGGLRWRVHRPMTEHTGIDVHFVETEAMLPEQAIDLFDRVCECEPTGEGADLLESWCTSKGYTFNLTEA